MMIRTPSFVSNRTIFKIGKASSPSSVQSNNSFYLLFICFICYLVSQVAVFFIPRIYPTSLVQENKCYPFPPFSPNEWVRYTLVLTEWNVIMPELYP